MDRITETPRNRVNHRLVRTRPLTDLRDNITRTARNDRNRPTNRFETQQNRSENNGNTQRQRECFHSNVLLFKIRRKFASISLI